MQFTITSAENNSTFGNVFFTVPVKEELLKAEKNIMDICNQKISEIYNKNSTRFKLATTRLKQESEKMCITETAFYFLILKEISDISKQNGYPVMSSDLSGSVIAYLLGITSVDPLSINTNYSPIELLWGTDANPDPPSFETCIAQPIHPLIHKQLDNKYGFTVCNDRLYKEFSLIDSEMCLILGFLKKATHNKVPLSSQSQTLYIHIAQGIIYDYIYELELLGTTNDTFDQISHISNLAKELKQMPNIDFSFLFRLYAYCQGSFAHKKSLSALNDPTFFVTRDEFFNALTNHNMPVDVSLEFVKRGVWSEHNRDKYVNILKSYNMPKYICDFFDITTNLWDADACIGRLLPICELLWYKLNFPEEYARICKT